MLHKDDKQNNITLKWQNHERKYLIYMKITYLNKMKEEKWFRGWF